METKMEKLSTIQRHNNLNEVYRTGEPGATGLYYTYVVQRTVYPVGKPAQTKTVAEIQFQYGLYDEESVDGIESSNLLEIVRDRLKMYNPREHETKEITCALMHIEEALMWLNKRSDDIAEAMLYTKYTKVKQFRIQKQGKVFR